MVRTAESENVEKAKRKHLMGLCEVAKVSHLKNAEGNMVSVLREVEAQGFLPKDYKLLTETRLKAAFPCVSMRDLAALEEAFKIAANPFASPSDAAAGAPNPTLVVPESCAPASAVKPVFATRDCPVLSSLDDSPPVSEQALGSSGFGDSLPKKKKTGGARDKTQFIAPAGATMKASPNSGSISLQETRAAVDMFGE